jgi:transcriptional regulator with XRE-family HTH domain
MEWKSEEIRHLRLRLGWSRSDLARRLSLECSLVSLWEEGNRMPEFKESQMLDLIAKQADVVAEETSATPVAEIYCDETELDQCELRNFNPRQINT